MELLRNPADPGYPSEYLLSRIKGRRSRLVRDWRPLLFDPGLIETRSSPKTGNLQKRGNADSEWRQLAEEYGWVYSRMNRELRDAFFPFFLYTELRTIVLCLRRLVNGTTAGNESLLEKSLLSDALKEALRRSADQQSAVGVIERHFSDLSGRFTGLVKTLEADGPRGVEQRLVKTYLETMAGAGPHRLMKLFFARIIDARNILMLYKYLRLEFGVQPQFMSGGLVPETRLNELRDKDELSGLALLVREAAGISVERPEATAVEAALYRGITRWLRKEGREPFGIAPILDYLWRCSIEATQFSLLRHTRDLEREAAAAELAQ